MSLLDLTYFDTPDCNVPQGTYNTLQDHLDRYERDILIKILGYDLYMLVAAYANPGSTQRVIDIVEGKEYSEGDYTVKWNGLLNTDKVSLLAYYAYIEWIRNTVVSVQNIGTAVALTENGTVISAGAVMQRAACRMRELIGYPGNDLYAPTLYNFLLKYSDTYPEWIFNEVKPVNSFDL